jgi:HPt (histidine-containing phosphotransfer) domain-containing protein
MSQLEAHLDVARFVEQNGSIGLLKLVLPPFVEQMGLWLPAFERAIDNQDTASLLHLLHSMKGSASALYATPLAQTLQATELSLRGNPAPLPAAQLRQVGQQVSQLHQGLLQHLAAQAALHPAL